MGRGRIATYGELDLSRETSGFAKHFETGESLPKDLFDRLLAAKNYRAGSGMSPNILAIWIWNCITATPRRKKPSLRPEASGRRVDCFGTAFEDHLNALHIFAGGYSAGYYKWAEVLSADAFAAFEDAGLEDDDAIKTMGNKFRDTVLAQGGSRHPMDVFLDFRGREPSTEALKRHNGLL